MSNAVDYLPLVLLVLVFWFLILRPMRKRQQQFAATQKSIAAGSRVMLASGIFGDVISVEDETVELKISPETTVTVLRQAIARVVEAETVEPETPEGD
ncbi:preprotein translocase subunit YajC [Aeromicrobium sp.]